MAATASSAFVRAASSSSARPPAGSGPTALIAERTNGCTPGSRREVLGVVRAAAPQQPDDLGVDVERAFGSRAVRIVPTLLSTRKSANSAPNTKLSVSATSPAATATTTDTTAARVARLAGEPGSSSRRACPPSSGRIGSRLRMLQTSVV